MVYLVVGLHNGVVIGLGRVSIKSVTGFEIVPLMVGYLPCALVVLQVSRGPLHSEESDILRGRLRRTTRFEADAFDVVGRNLHHLASFFGDFHLVGLCRKGGKGERKDESV